MSIKARVMLSLDCFQESEEIKSNSLDQELKNKETELLQHKQEKLDQQEVSNTKDLKKSIKHGLE